MIRRRYFTMTPTPRLMEAVKQLGGDPTLVQSELLFSKSGDRRQMDQDEDRSRAESLFAQSFALQTLSLPTKRAELVQLIETEGFARFWTVQEFDGCEDLEDLAADLASSIRSPGITRAVVP
jgi:hypothetical protein